MAEGAARRAEEALIAYAATLPGAWEDHRWRHAASRRWLRGVRVMKVGRRVFAFFGAAGAPEGRLSLMTRLPASAELALTLPFTERAGHGLGRAGWIHSTLGDGDEIDLATFRGWIEQSYRAAATRALVRQLDARSPGPARGTSAVAPGDLPAYEDGQASRSLQERQG
jgi:predicted DNA-binding protein (MmcQ/YjbR family)